MEGRLFSLGDPAGRRLRQCCRWHWLGSRARVPVARLCDVVRDLYARHAALLGFVFPFLAEEPRSHRSFVQ